MVRSTALAFLTLSPRHSSLRPSLAAVSGPIPRYAPWARRPLHGSPIASPYVTTCSLYRLLRIVSSLETGSYPRLPLVGALRVWYSLVIEAKPMALAVACPWERAGRCGRGCSGAKLVLSDVLDGFPLGSGLLGGATQVWRRG